MSIGIPDLNASLRSIREIANQVQKRSAISTGGVGGNISQSLSSQHRAANLSNFQPGSRGSVLAGFINRTGSNNLTQNPTESRPGELILTTLDSTSDPYELRNNVSGLQNEIDSLAGTFSEAGSEVGGFLEEVITLGSPASINHALNLITGRSMEDLRSHLEEFAISDVSELVTQGIPQFDRNFQELSGIMGGLNLESLLGEISTRVSAIIPSFSGNIIDDIIRDIDPNITSELQSMLGTSAISSIRPEIIRNLVLGDIESAAELVQNFPTGLTDLGEILDRLSAIEIDPMIILEGGTEAIGEFTQEILGGRGTWTGANTNVTPAPSPTAGNNTSTGNMNTYSFDFVDTAEEFEADISSSTRQLDEVIIHMTGTPSTYNGDANDIHEGQTAAGYDGIQYHYIIRRDGRVQRGRPISTTGPSGETQIDIAFVGTTTAVETYDPNEQFRPNDQSITTVQGKTYNAIMTALFRVIPGANTIGAAELDESSTAEPTERINPTNRNMTPPIPFSPNNINGCVNGRMGAGRRPGTTGPGGGNSGDIRPYPGPGVSSQHQLTGDISGLDGVLISIIEKAAEATGLRPVCGSGNRGRGGSGRHAGYASDTVLYNGNRLLSVTVPDDLAYVQEFTRQFLIGCRERGENPSVGIANHAYSILYMSGTSYHFDIARGNSIGVNRGKYWGGSGERSAHIPVPQWLVTMFAAENF